MGAMMIEILKTIAAMIVAGTALWGIYVYFTNSRLRRAEWLASLYEKFYERPELKVVREVLDCEGGQFEFVAVLRKSGQLTQEEIEDLFHYYLDCIENCRAVRAYIAKKGYEQLDRLLQERAQQK
jgi:hypothetical protein